MTSFVQSPIQLERSMSRTKMLSGDAKPNVLAVFQFDERKFSILSANPTHFCSVVPNFCTRQRQDKFGFIEHLEKG